MDENTLYLINHSDKKLDFKHLITLKESIIIDNCDNVEIIINKCFFRINWENSDRSNQSSAICFPEL